MPDSGAPPRRLVDGLLLGLAGAVLLWHVPPSLLLSSTTTTGGDTASHYYTAQYLRDVLLPSGSLFGWDPGHYAGQPVFQLYFPLPFVVMVGLSAITGLPVAFKLVTIAGVFLLPFCTWATLRLLRLPPPAPALGAVATLPFLFLERNAMWGGNLPSTLAGEFTYSIGLALLVLWLGTLYRGVVTDRNLVLNAVGLAAIGLCHAYALVLGGAASLFLIVLVPGVTRVARYLAGMHALAFCLIGFWIVPLLGHAEFTTPYDPVWGASDWQTVFPRILAPALALAAGLVVVEGLRWLRAGLDPAAGDAAEAGTARDAQPHDARPIVWLALVGVAAIGCYLIAHLIDGVDIRFLPLLQLIVCLLAAASAGRLLRAAGELWWTAAPDGMRAANLTALGAVVLAAATVGWTEAHVAYTDAWVAWNYEGFESKAGWPAYQQVNRLVQRGPDDPRVVYEHTARHEEAGTTRAFESLPLFAGASTLEGVYMQATPTAPFVFYVQSLVSPVTSCPFPDYHCGNFDVGRAVDKLLQFNVDTIIARTDAAKEAYAASPRTSLVRRIGPYEVYAVDEADGRYVVPLENAPVVLGRREWKEPFFRWFKRAGSEAVTLVADVGDTSRFEHRVADLESVAAVPLGAAPEVEVELSWQHIRIRTTRPGHPLLIRVSYHPRWRVDGADAVYLVSPSFMLVVPDREEVTLTFGTTGFEWLGWALTLAGLLVVFAPLAPAGLRRSGLRMVRRLGITAVRNPDSVAVGDGADGGAPRSIDVAAERHRRVWGPILVVAVLATGAAIKAARPDPGAVHDGALEAFRAERYDAAADGFARVIDERPTSRVAMEARYYSALVAQRQGRGEEAIALASAFVEDYPDASQVAEMHFRIGEVLEAGGDAAAARDRFRLLRQRFPDSEFAVYARERLRALRDG